MPTAQEEFWAGDFGRDYTIRNRVNWRARVPFWAGILARTYARLVLEVGCNAGWNLLALQAANPDVDLHGCDVNPSALAEADINGFRVNDTPAAEVGKRYPNQFDLVFTAGVLIHIGPADIEAVMRSIAQASRKYVLAVEYTADREEEVLYRGHAERLWRRPFKEMYQDIGLLSVAYGKAPDDAFDRCHWCLLEKPS